jgi:hypothetical protein
MFTLVYVNHHVQVFTKPVVRVAESMVLPLSCILHFALDLLRSEARCSENPAKEELLLPLEEVKKATHVHKKA